MKTLITLSIALLLASLSFGQVALSTTTLGAALPQPTPASPNQTTVTLASTSTMLNSGPSNQINTCFYVDKELFGVVTVVDSTHVIVQQRGRGCGALGAGARPTAHANSAKVFFANTVTNGNFITPAASYIAKNEQPTGENLGSCTPNTLLSLPVIYQFSGDIVDCKRTGAAGTGGQFILVGNGTMGSAGQRIAGFCTGTAGSAETEYLNSAACSGATTLTARQIVATSGTLANLSVVSSATATGGTGKDVLTVYLNGSASALTCTMAASATVCGDTTHSVAVVAGDVIAFQFVSATSDTAANISAVVGQY